MIRTCRPYWHNPEPGHFYTWTADDSIFTNETVNDDYEDDDLDDDDDDDDYDYDDNDDDNYGYMS